jgi:DNA invertase Pin-like site-specific DNA recombinase
VTSGAGPSAHVDGVSGRPRRPEMITPGHFEKLALVYPRQSSAAQVRDNTGSTAEQLELADLAREWGWSDDRILILDEDLGKSGESTAARGDFKRMVNLITAGDVGIVLARDLTRIGRDAAHLLDFRKLLAWQKVLLYSEGHVMDPSADDPAKKLEYGVKSLFGEYDNDTRARNARQGRIKRAEQGYAVSRPPIGYVKSARGLWTKDPDPEVQQAVGHLFELAPKFGSLAALVAYLNEHNLLLPKRARGKLSWERASRVRVYSILTNPQYTGSYVYRRQKVTRDPVQDKRRVEPRPNKERICNPGHHDAYVTQETWDKIQTALASRSPRQRPVVGAGGALLQGLLRCPQRHRMHTTYTGRPGRRIGSYRCQVRNKWGDTLHIMTCSARLVDPAVVREVLRALGPLEMPAALAAVADARHAHTGIVRAHQRRLQQAEDEAEERYQRYLAVDPKNALAKAALEAAWNQALIRCQQLTRELAQAEKCQPVTLREADAAELLTLASKIEALWNGPATTNRDRKEILRTALSEVVVTANTNEAIDLELAWVGGMRQRLQVLRPRGLDERVKELRRAGTDAATMAQQLNAEGHTTAKGNPITRKAVYVKLDYVGMRRKHLRREMLLALRQMLIDGMARDQMLKRLATDFPALCKWTRPHLNQLTAALRRGIPGIPPLPGELPATREKRAVVEFIQRCRDTGDTWEATTAKLNASDLRPQRAIAFTVAQVVQLVSRRSRRRLPEAAQMQPHRRGLE